jgi:hypothetical protein
MSTEHEILGKLTGAERALYNATVRSEISFGETEASAHAEATAKLIRTRRLVRAEAPIERFRNHRQSR